MNLANLGRSNAQLPTSPGTFDRALTVSVRCVRGRAHTDVVSVANFGVLLCIVSLAAPGLADELADKGRAIFKNNQHVVVTVQVVLKSKFSMGGVGGAANESRQDLTGTVLDPSGLTVLALSATDPGQMMQNMMA